MDIREVYQGDDKGNHSISIILVHALLVVVGPLGDHRGCGHVGGFDIVFVANESLGMESEGVSHQFRDAVIY